jgi:hypothetical protein
MAENDSSTEPRPPLLDWIFLSELEEVLVRLLEAYPALAAIPIRRIIEEIWDEIKSPVPLIWRIPHWVLERLVPGRSLPFGFAESGDYLMHRIIVSQFGWHLVDWAKGTADWSADRKPPSIMIYSPALRQWLEIWARRHSPRPKPPPVAKAQEPASPTIIGAPNISPNQSTPAPAAAPERQATGSSTAPSAPAPAPGADSPAAAEAGPSPPDPFEKLAEEAISEKEQTPELIAARKKGGRQAFLRRVLTDDDKRAAAELTTVLRNAKIRGDQETLLAAFKAELSLERTAAIQLYRSLAAEVIYQQGGRHRIDPEQKAVLAEAICRWREARKVPGPSETS